MYKCNICVCVCVCSFEHTNVRLYINVEIIKTNPISIFCHKSLNRQHEKNIKIQPVNTQYNKELLAKDVEPGAL